MLILLSPSKTMSWVTPHPPESSPPLLDRALPLAESLRAESPASLARWMKLSPPLAAATHADIQSWTPEGRGAALFAYTGEAFKSLDAPTLPPEALALAQRRLRVLSGLYGALRPLDAICPYRLEAASRPPHTPSGLYAYWRERVTDHLNEEIEREGCELVLNLASQEYSALIDPSALRAPLLTPDLSVTDPSGARRVVGVYAKRARGLIARHALLRGIASREAAEALCLELSP
jgi:cytoplasmic iron level regulating protein YaaA (DUF328/UPF0246 family)